VSALVRTRIGLGDYSSEIELLAQLKIETKRLCDIVVRVETSRRGGDLKADLDALEEQAGIVRGLL
jgi:hypothetical protein